LKRLVAATPLLRFIFGDRENDASTECGDESIVVRVFVNANQDPLGHGAT
jgi:hypothetical protein